MAGSTITHHELSLKTVDNLRLNQESNPQRYFIAAYQRGYRWSSTQVTQLLDDIREFANRANPQPDQFYCLQPLVLKVAKDGGYEVVDGQQRLTTLLLILRYFNKRTAEEYREKVFTIEYKTRPNLLEFLNNPTKELADTNADYFHLLEAVNAIEEWFSDKGGEVGDLTSTLRNRTKVIWYLLPDRDDPVKAFTRLNVGKIQLTADELIRALFLRRTGTDPSASEDLRREIANEWDQIEKSLQKDAVWYFLSNDEGRRHNRINLVLELVAESYGLKDVEKKDAYGVFYAFNRRLAGGDSPKSVWREVTNTFMMLEEWFENRRLYHIVGFLVNEGVTIGEIRCLAANRTKQEFEDELRRTVFSHVIGTEPPADMDQAKVRDHVSERLAELTYEKQSDRARIRSLLLFFNVTTLLDNKKSTIRFQFDSYKEEDWNIEHVRSVAPDRLESHTERSEWLRQSLQYLTLQGKKKPLCDAVEAYLTLPKREALEPEFASLYKKIITHFKESIEDKPDHGVANLVLLDAATNKSYKNAVFEVKRHRILSLDRAGIFVPLCTRNVFLKCYGDRVEHLMYWTDADREAYQTAILETLVRFFTSSQRSKP